MGAVSQCLEFFEVGGPA